MPISPKRVLAVTAGLLGVGALCGTALGAIIVGAFLLRYGPTDSPPEIWPALGFGAGVGAVFGAVLTPLLAWIFLRRVPLGRAIVETSIGILAGVALAMIFAPTYWLGAALLGFLTAGVRLFVVSRRGGAVSGGRAAAP